MYNDFFHDKDGNEKIRDNLLNIGKENRKTILDQKKADSKIKVICAHLREIAIQQGPGTRLPSMRDLCQLLSTTRVTLGEALDILEAQNIIYRRERSGIFVSPKLERRTICVLISSSLFLSPGTSPVWGMLWALLAAEAERRVTYKNEYYSFHLVMENSSQQNTLPEEVISMVNTGRVHGIINLGLNNYNSLWLSQKGIPCANFASPPYNAAFVVMDHDAMVRMAIDQLVQQGCQRIALWRVNPTDIVQERASDLWPDDLIFQNVLQDYGLPFYPELAKYTSSQSTAEERRSWNLQDWGYHYALEVFGQSYSMQPDGIYVDDDMITSGALVALQKSGLHIGQDIKIATHANAGSVVLFGYAHELIVLEFDPESFVQALFALLDELMENPQATPRKIVVSPRLRS